MEEIVKTRTKKRRCRKDAILELPPDVLYLIFSLLVPIPDPTSAMTNERKALHYFRTAVPYNVTSVCRTWRAFMHSTPIFWRDFSLSLVNPSFRTLRQAVSLVLQHTSNSLDLPLTVDVRIAGTYDAKLTQWMTRILANHQARWRKINLWFDENVLGDPVPTIDLDPRVMSLLEEFTTNHGSSFRTIATANHAVQHPIQPFKRLSLEMHGNYTHLHRWLNDIQEPEELCLCFSDWDEEEQNNAQELPIIQLDRLTKIIINSRPDRLAAAGKAGAFLIRHLTCTSLTNLFLRVDGETCTQHLRNFFSRSENRLENLVLHIPGGVEPNDRGRRALLDEIMDGLGGLNDLTSLVLSSRFLGSVDALLENLGQPGVLPNLQHLEFHFLPSTLFADFIVSRWRSSHERIFRSIRLLSCAKIRFGVQFGPFHPGDGQMHLPDGWERVWDCIVEGLRVEIE